MTEPMTEPKVSLPDVIAPGVKESLAKSRWLKENSVLLVLLVVLFMAVGGLILLHHYGHLLEELWHDVIRDLIIAVLVGITVGLFYELVARKTMSQELLKIVNEQLDFMRSSQRIASSGLVDVARSRAFVHQDIPATLVGAKQIRILALHGKRLWANSDLKHALLNKGTQSKILMLNYECEPYIIARADESPDDYDANAIQSQIKSELQVLQKFQETRGNGFEIRLYDEPPSFWLVFIDDVAYVSGYSKGRDTQDTEVYKFRKQKNSMYHLFSDYFDRLWETSFKL
jgi:hypothetical protein